MAESEAYAAQYHQGYERHRAQKLRTAMVRLNRAAAWLTVERPRLLDIGCSVGCTVEAADARGWKGVGVDVSEDAVSYCRSRGLDCQVVGPVELPFADQSFDVVVNWHVIEHVADVKQTLEEWRRVLKPGGVLFLETPDATCGKVRRLKEKYRKFWAPEHTYTFTPDNLGRFLSLAGFQLLPTPWLGPLRRVGLRQASYICGYQTYQALRQVLGVSKAFQICARREPARHDAATRLPNAA
jgi:SAM-dependent methyltransferase